MILVKYYKYTLVRNIPNQPIKRFISSTTHQLSTSTNSRKVNADKNNNENTLESYQPLTENEIQKIINLDNIHIVTKYQQKKPQRPPLLQNFFIGKVDNELLTYPEVMEVKDFNSMRDKLKPITDYFTKDAKAPIDLRFRDVSNKMLTDFRNMKLFGANVHQRYAGLGNFTSEMAWSTESEANDLKSYLVLAAHRLAVEAISGHGNTSQQTEYLMEMGKGLIKHLFYQFDQLNMRN